MERKRDMNTTQLVTLPVFPLGTTLYPGGLLSLNIFELRYLEMIKNCLRDQVPFGVVTLDQGSEVRTPQEKINFARVGTLANIIYHEAIEPSLFFIQCTGGSRFTIRASKRKKNGLWVADVEAMADDEAIPVPPELKIVADTLQKVIAAMSKQGLNEPGLNEQGSNDQFLPFCGPYLFQDCGWVANRWCELLPLSAGQREHLLSLANPRLRLDLVFDVLEDIGISNIHNL